MLNHKTLSILLGMLLLIVGSAAYAALPPRISWTPAQLTPASMAPGTSTSYTVVLKHTGILPIPATNQLRIVAEGVIAPFVTITQPKFPPVFKRGDQVTVSITVSVPANTPVSVKNGTLVLKRILPNGKVMEVWRADALPTEFTFSTIPLPPDPGEAGKATIEGIDSDNDGVRDDVQRWIGLNAWTTESGHAGLMQYANAMQDFLVAPDEQSTVEAANAMHDARTCFNFVRRGNKDATEVLGYLSAQYLNTIERSTRYINAQAILSGSIFSIPNGNWQKKCTFDPLNMDT